MVRLALVGGMGVYHAQAFSALINGPAPGQTIPQGWPAYPQQVEGCRVTACWDEDIEVAKKLAEVFGIDHVVAKQEDVLQYCDGVIITDDVTSQHQKRAPLFLRAGVPTYVDKSLSLAADVAEAEALVALAEKTGAPMMSCSALRYAAESEHLRAHPDELGDVAFATAIGISDLVTYGIHPMELAHSILGRGIATVQSIGAEPTHIIKMTYTDGRVLMLFVSKAIAYTFQLNLYGSKGSRQVNVTDGAAFYANTLRAVMKMVEDKKSPLPIEYSLEIIKALTAAKRSLEEGGTIIKIG